MSWKSQRPRSHRESQRSPSCNMHGRPATYPDSVLCREGLALWRGRPEERVGLGVPGKGAEACRTWAILLPADPSQESLGDSESDRLQQGLRLTLPSLAVSDSHHPTHPVSCNLLNHRILLIKVCSLLRVTSQLLYYCKVQLNYLKDNQVCF